MDNSETDPCENSSIGEVAEAVPTRKLTDIFVVPPLSVLDTRQKYWKDRKKEWLALGLQSELGRSKNLLKQSKLIQTKHHGTSIFDPVLCEVVLRWFSQPGDSVLDPFAGGSVRGVVASRLGRRYTGVELRPEQVEQNRAEARLICDKHVEPTWLVGDSRNMLSQTPEADIVFTCPPYYGLERYSDSNDDLSAMTPDDFDAALQDIITKSVERLKQNRFAVFVIGDVRSTDENGSYLNLPGKTVSMFEAAGCRLYNEAILLQEPASAAMRAFRSMNSNLKMPKCHQNVYVFIKGSARLATRGTFSLLTEEDRNVTRNVALSAPTLQTSIDDGHNPKKQRTLQALLGVVPV
jgi:DNA modification methylase